MRYKCFKQLAVFAVLSFSMPLLHAQPEEIAWSKHISSSGEQSVIAMAVDDLGNVITAGYFFDLMDADPGTGEATLLSAGSEDIYVQKLDAQGNLLWAHVFGSNASDYPTALVTDASGNIYMTGWYTGTLDFDPGAASFELSDFDSNKFLLKLDSNGDFLWVKSLGDAQDVKDIHIDNENDLYLVGEFSGATDFDPGPDTHEITTDALDGSYIQKLNSEGGFMWANAYGNTGSNTIKSVDTDAFGNVYVAGRFQGTVDFDTSEGEAILETESTIDLNAYVLKLDRSGAFEWVKRFGGLATSPVAITVNDAQLCVVGQHNGTGDFDPSDEEFILSTDLGTEGMFSLKLDSEGTFEWARHLSSPSYIESRAAVMDSYGKLYVAGNFSSTVNFATSEELEISSQNDTPDIFLLQYDAAGELNWATSYGGNDFDRVRSLVLDDSHALHMSGTFKEEISFAEESYTAEAAQDTYILKFNATEGGVALAEWAKESFAIYPNPSSGRLHIKASEEMKSIKLFGIDGELMASYKVNRNAFVLDTGFPVGIYFVVAEMTSGKQIQEKLVIHHEYK